MMASALPFFFVLPLCILHHVFTSKEGHYFLLRSEQLSYLLTHFLGWLWRISYQQDLSSARCLHAALHVRDTSHQSELGKLAGMRL